MPFIIFSLTGNNVTLAIEGSKLKKNYRKRKIQNNT